VSNTETPQPTRMESTAIFCKNKGNTRKGNKASAQNTFFSLTEEVS
jgi:hypothetical protein